MFISRGRGRGHAGPDIEIARVLSTLLPNVSIKFVSYSTGAETLRSAGHTVIDLDLPELNPFMETLIRITHVANDLDPDLVVAHEEFSAPIASRLLGVPCMFITDWFPPIGTTPLEALESADKILFMDDPGISREPVHLRHKIKYLGPLIGELKYSSSDRDQVRRTLGLPLDRPVILVAPGGSTASSEEQAPIFDLVVSAVAALPENPKLVWIMTADEQRKLRAEAKVLEEILFLEPHRGFDRTMIAADIAITKGTRTTVFEFSALGTPSISLSHGHNPVDDLRVPRISTNLALQAQSITSEYLAHCISKALVQSKSMILERSMPPRSGCSEAARAIRSYALDLAGAVSSPLKPY